MQTEAALADCDAILFVVDARAGLNPADRHFAAAVRRAGKPIIVVANKAEGRARDGVYEAFSLGLGDPIALSAEHGEGLGELYDALVEVLPPAARPVPEEQDEAEPLHLGEEEDGSELDVTKPLRIAVLGRPNAGKSTLINRILGQDRLLTGPEPGITRDSIGLDAEWRGRKLKIFDTAGLRRRSRVVEKVEKLAVADALRAVRFAEVVVLLLDATIPFEKQDLTLADLVEQEGRALVIGLNKWDLIDNKSDKARELRAEADRLLPQLRGTRVIPVSGLTGAHVDKLMEAIVATDAIWNTRISTGRLNRWLAPVVDATPPPAVQGGGSRFATSPSPRRVRRSSSCSAIRSRASPRATSVTSSTACARPSASSASRSASRCAPAARTPTRRKGGGGESLWLGAPLEFTAQGARRAGTRPQLSRLALVRQRRMIVLVSKAQ